jgi:hypothetical protein
MRSVTLRGKPFRRKFLGEVGSEKEVAAVFLSEQNQSDRGMT